MTSCAVRTDGSLLCWGDNTCGALGAGARVPEFTLTPTAALVRDVVSVGLGDSVCAVHRDGAVSCWGAWLALGDGNPSNPSDCTSSAGKGGRLTPGDVPSVRDAVEIVGAANGGMCVLRASGSVSCWGRWDFGSLSPETPQAPEDIEGLTNAIHIGGVGVYHGCALRADRRVACWGFGEFKTILTGPGTDYKTGAQLVEGLDDIVDLSVGAQHSCALRSTGEVFCWGENVHGELGVPPGDKPPTTLVKVTGLD